MTVQETTDYHVRQMDGDGGYCNGKNCAAASGARAVYGAKRERMTADQFRAESRVSCVPGVDSPSGGLRIGDVVRVCDRHGVHIDYGITESGFTRWAPSTALYRLGMGYGAVFLGDYDQLPTPYRAPSSTFQGDHSAYGHDYRKASDSVCWHDPLRLTGIRLPTDVLMDYWWKRTSSLRGYAGFVRELRIPDTSTTTGDDMARAIRTEGRRISSDSVVRVRAGTVLYSDALGKEVVRTLSESTLLDDFGVPTGTSGWRAVRLLSGQFDGDSDREGGIALVRSRDISGGPRPKTDDELRRTAARFHK